MSHFIRKFTQQLVLGCLMSLAVLSTHAGKPLFILTPVTPTTLSVPSNSTVQVQYTVINNTKTTRTLTIQAQTAITQSTSGAGTCTSPFTLIPNQSCTLILRIDGATLAAAASPVVTSGPVVCKTKGNDDNNPDPFLCAQPAVSNMLNISLGSPLTTAEITVTGSPLTLTASGSAGTLTINNNSTAVTATNISSNFTGTALAGLVTQTASTCTSVAPGSSCTLTFTPGDTAVSQTNFPIQGDNTTLTTGAITISDSLTTLFSGGNGQAGNIFNVTNLSSSPIIITSFDINLQPGTGQLIVYYLESAATGFETDPAPWHTLGSATVISNGSNVATPLPVGGLTIPAGATYGIYITENASSTPFLNYTNGSNTYADSQLSIQTLTGRAYPPFSSSVFRPRQWNGTIFYN